MAASFSSSCPPAGKKHAEVLQTQLLSTGQGTYGKVDILDKIDAPDKEEDGGIGRNAILLIDLARRGIRAGLPPGISR